MCVAPCDATAIHWGLGWGLPYSPRSSYSVYVCLLTRRLILTPGQAKCRLARLSPLSSLLSFERRLPEPTSMSTQDDENVAQQQPSGNDGYSPFKMGGSPYSPFKNGAPEPHHISHKNEVPWRIPDEVACCAQAPRRIGRLRLRRSSRRCGPPGSPRSAARPPAASAGRHEAAARVRSGWASGRSRSRRWARRL